MGDANTKDSTNKEHMHIFFIMSEAKYRLILIKTINSKPKHPSAQHYRIILVGKEKYMYHVEKRHW